MQPNPQARADKIRFRVDAIAKHVVTVFGLLVLALFMLLILHILGNAFPLLKTPKLQFDSRNTVSSPSPFLSIQQMGDEVVALSFDKCQVQVHSVSTGGGVSEGFKHPCNAEFVEINANHGYATHYGILREDALVELYSINNLSGKVQRSLLGSFSIAALIKGDEQTRFANLAWQIDMYQNTLMMHARLDDNEVALITHKLNTLSPPQLRVIEQVHSLTALPRFEQVLVGFDGSFTLLDKNLTNIQSLPNHFGINAHVLISPNQRSVYIQNKNFDIEVWHSNNVSGQFLLTHAGYLDSETVQKNPSSKELTPSEKLGEDAQQGIQQIVFDRQKMLAIALNGDYALTMFNSATQEHLNTLFIDEPIQQIHWHNQQLYLFSEHRTGQIEIARYTLQNAAGITTWNSLFNEVQYSGYQDAQYIWQTSQSAEYAQAKFSLIPLIIGSLKASVLALFVAIPLSLGAAIYTAYFATAKLRAWVKPSIEMIEAIPSVIIGFIAAIWLAPFAERSLFALLGMLVCLPFIVLGFAALQGLVKRSENYQQKQGLYLLLTSFAFLALLAGVFQLFVLLQGLFSTTQAGLLSGMFVDITLSKTTIVVALALGIAVAPTIYSLVDDALFEVPDGVKQAAFALGATELQTLVKVVLVVALPSIISAIMLGLGRAFGETMIVLMVTGNTPIANWDLLSGLRSLTSNLTIELQESSIGSAHYHILFLTAAILFAFTFIINTIASFLKRKLQGDKHV
jgi:phosphate transport system permease protein